MTSPQPTPAHTGRTAAQPSTPPAQATRSMWPFPANGQPVPWSAAQIAAYAAEQRNSLGEATL